MAIDSKRIAQNTGFLYVRLLLVMGVNLYAARVVLEILGVTDYGLYCAVFSVIGLLSFLNGTLSGGTSRFITYELGRGKLEKLKLTFDTALAAHGLLACVILVLGETIGLWYASHMLVVPLGRFHAAMTVYQISIATTALTIIQVPFSAEIIAHERMNIYAYMGIYEALARLVVVNLLVHAGFDKLIYYAWLQAGVVLSVTAFNIYYSMTRFREVSFCLSFNKCIFKSILKFSGWNIISNLSETLMSQGVIMLYNLFFLPVVVAAQAIANQIAIAISNIVNNVRQAVNPQVIKLFADNQQEESKRLTLKSAEYIFYILLLFGVPCIMVMPRLLSIWLVEVPEYAVAFARLIIVQQILGNFSAAFYAPMLAANKLAKNSLASVFLCIFQFMVLWLLFRIGFGPLWARYLGLLSSVLFSFAIKPYILWKDIHYDIKQIYSCIFHCMKVLMLVVITCVIVYCTIPQNSLNTSVFVAVISICAVVVYSYICMDKGDMGKLLSLIRAKSGRTH